MQKMLGQAASLHHRPDGKPVVAVEEAYLTEHLSAARSAVWRVDALNTKAIPTALSIAHTEKLTMAVSGSAAITCDVEEVVERPVTTGRGCLGRNATAWLRCWQMARMKIIPSPRHASGQRRVLEEGWALVHAPLLLVSGSDDGWMLCGQADS